MSEQPQKLVSQFFTYLSHLRNSENKIDLASLQKYMADECVVESNGEILCQGIHEFMAYIARMQQKYERVSYSNLFEEPLSKDKTSLRFQLDCLNRAGAKRVLETVAILTIQDGKISYWQEVFRDLTPLPQ